MEMTEEGLALIRRFEGFRAAAYRCPAGSWTIGYGHTSEAGAPVVRPGMRISEAEAREILARDVERFAADVRQALTQQLSNAQFSALVSFAYNVGTPAFRRSSVLKAVNAGRFDKVPAALKLWVKAKGRVLPGLERRRAAEVELFMSDAPPRAGRAEAGVPKSTAQDGHKTAAGAAAGAGAVVVAASGSVPDWVIVAALLVLVAAAAWIIWTRIKSKQGVA